MADYKGLKVGGDGTGRTYELDGKEVDLNSDKDSDKGIVSAIKLYKPTKGEYHYNEADNTLIPAGARAGTGDTGMYPDERRSRTHSPAANSFDEIGRKAAEETDVSHSSPGAGVTDDKGLEAQEKEAKEAEKKAADERAKAAKEHEDKAAKANA